MKTLDKLKIGNSRIWIGLDKVCKNGNENATHHVILDNVRNDEILNHCLLICKGHIENPANCKCSPLPHIQVRTTNNENPSQISINPKTATFKFIIELKHGKNILFLSYCCTSTHIALEYKPRNTNFSVVPLYIICAGHNGRFQAPERETNTPESACKRILTGCRMIQSLFAEKLHEAGLGRKTFHLESECVIFHSRLHFRKAHEMSQVELWYYFAREIMNSSIGSCNRKYLAFLSCTVFSANENINEHDEIVKLTKGYVAFGGEGLALLGTACLYTWPESVQEIESRFCDNSAVDRMRFMDDSCYRGTLGGCFSTTLGATLHELCHTFDLGHTQGGIMDRGFDNIQKVFLPSSEECFNKCDIQTENSRKANISSIYFKCRTNDDTYWTKNCLAILNYHKWFNCINSRRKCTISYDANTKIVKCTAGLRVIEIRRESDEMLLKYWVFMDKVLKYSFQVADVKEYSELKILVIEDNDGNVVKQAV